MGAAMGTRNTIIGEEEQSEPWRRRLTKRAIIVSAVATATLLAAGGVAIASVASRGGGVLHGCYSTSTGALRLINPPAHQYCKAGEKAIQWNASGITWRGNWNRNITYSVHDAVVYGGSSYLATAGGAGRVPSASSRAWSVLAASGASGPAGPAGATGPTGPTGPAGPSGSSAFAEFYALMPGDNAATVAVGGSVQFPQNGPTDGSSTITRLTASTFNLAAIGTYEVAFQVSVTEAGQLDLTLNSGGGALEQANTVVGRATGTSQIWANTLIVTTVINTVLSVKNPAGESTALTITPLAGGTDPVSATLVIQRLVNAPS
jgi:hypothetical protein